MGIRPDKGRKLVCDHVGAGGRFWMFNLHEQVGYPLSNHGRVCACVCVCVWLFLRRPPASKKQGGFPVGSPVKPSKNGVLEKRLHKPSKKWGPGEKTSQTIQKMGSWGKDFTNHSKNGVLGKRLHKLWFIVVYFLLPLIPRNYGGANSKKRQTQVNLRRPGGR